MIRSNNDSITTPSRDPDAASSANLKKVMHPPTSWRDSSASHNVSAAVSSAPNSALRSSAANSANPVNESNYAQLAKLSTANLQAELARLRQIGAEMDDKLRRKRQLLTEGQSAVQYFSVNSGELEHNIEQLRKKLDRETQRVRDTLWGYIVRHCREFSAIPAMAATDDGRYRMGKVLAAGDRAQIRHCTTGGAERKGPVVLKSFDKSELTLQEVQKIANEIRCLRRLKHPNIIKLLHVAHSPSHINLAMPHAGQTLFELSSTRGVGFKQREVLQVLRGLIPAVAYAHDCRVCHRDLKPENILIKVNSDGDFRVKLIDLGLAAILPPGHGRLSGFCGTPGFIAPELIVNPSAYNGYAVDMWAVGCIVLELLVGRNVAEEMWMPIYDESVCEDAQQFMKQLGPALGAVVGYASRPEHCPSSCPELIALLTSLLCVDPQQRAPAAQAAKSPFFAISERKSPALLARKHTPQSRPARRPSTSESRHRSAQDVSKKARPPALRPRDVAARPSTSGFLRVRNASTSQYLDLQRRSKGGGKIRSMASMPSRLPTMASTPSHRPRGLPSLGALAAQPRPQQPFARKPPTHPFDHGVRRQQSLPLRPATTASGGRGHFRFPSKGRPPPPKPERPRRLSSGSQPSLNTTKRTATRKRFFPSSA